jgi:hypothetical protein
MAALPHLNGIVIIVGNYGSGKTEVALNLALQQAETGNQVSIADLDLVNPYFRTREIRGLLARSNAKPILPEERLLNADLPILSPNVLGAIRKNQGLTILDVGGNDVGATVLASLADVLKGKSATVLQVVNPFRPYTETVKGCIRIQKEIENASRLAVNAWVGNPHLMELTEVKHLERGYRFMVKLSEETGLPVQFVTVPIGLLNQLKDGTVSFPALHFTRRLSFPWNGKK